jgi:hypothetical protein
MMNLKKNKELITNYDVLRDGPWLSREIVSYKKFRTTFLISANERACKNIYKFKILAFHDTC